MSATLWNPKAELNRLRWLEDMVVVNPFGERVWLKALIQDGRRLGITDCCFASVPCDRHRILAEGAKPYPRGRRKGESMSVEVLITLRIESDLRDVLDSDVSLGVASKVLPARWPAGMRCLEQTAVLTGIYPERKRVADHDFVGCETHDGSPTSCYLCGGVSPDGSGCLPLPSRCETCGGTRKVNTNTNKETAMQPTTGRIVLYTLTEDNAAQVNRRRTTGKSIAERMKLELDRLNHERDEGVQAFAWPAGAQAHIGNSASAGDVVPLIVVKVWPNEYGEGIPGVNGQALLDGNDVLWITSAKEGTEPGTWAWPTRA